MKTGSLKLVTATGSITTGDAYLRSVTLTSGGDAASITVRTNGASGTVIVRLTVAAAAMSVGTGYLGDVACPQGLHVTVDSGTTPSVMVAYA